MILNRGALDMASEEGSLALCAAARAGHLHTVQLLLERGADVHTLQDKPLKLAGTCLVA